MLLFWHCKWGIYAKFIRWMVYKRSASHACTITDRDSHIKWMVNKKERVLLANTLARNIIHLCFESKQHAKTAKNLAKMVIEPREERKVICQRWNVSTLMQLNDSTTHTKIVFVLIGLDTVNCCRAHCKNATTWNYAHLYRRVWENELNPLNSYSPMTGTQNAIKKI